MERRSVERRLWAAALGVGALAFGAAGLLHAQDAEEPSAASDAAETAIPPGPTCCAAGLPEPQQSTPPAATRHAALAIARAHQGLPAYPKVVEAKGLGGAVATGHPLATQAALRVLRAGGSAADAAVAAALTLGVAEPYHAGLGGGGFAVQWLASERSAEVVDFRERAPLARPPEGYATLPRRKGCTAVAIPGAAAGLWALHQGGGRLPWEALFEDAVEAAEEGVVVGGLMAARIRERVVALGEDADAASIYMPGGHALKQGQVLRQTELARSMRALAARGPGALYGGPLAAALVEGCRDRGGLMTEEDFFLYRARVGPAATTTVGDQVLHTVGPPSIGGLQVMQMYRMARALPLKAPYGRPQNMHLLSEAMRISFADRTVHASDGERSVPPLDRFMDEQPALLAVGRISPLRRIPLDDLRTVDKPLDGGTTHISVVDREGNAVALTMTINFRFGAAVVGRGTGILLNDTMDDFSAPPGESNIYHLSDGPLNTPAPGAPPVSSMSPTLVTQAGVPVLVLGGVGGPMIPTSVMQVMVNRFVHGMPLRTAIGVPRIHHQLLPDRVSYEGAHLSDDARAFLEERGHTLFSVRNIGTIYAVELGADGSRVAVADVRSHGAAGVEVPSGEHRPSNVPSAR